jgi:hypothetical protein
MVEVDLEEFEEFYKERLNTQYYKIKRALRKILSDIRDGLINIKLTMDHFRESASQKVDEKSLRSLNLFYDRVRNNVDEIEIPEENNITYEKLNELTSKIKKLFTTTNEIARKTLPKFQKLVQPEIKELNYVTRKLGKKQAVLEKFMRKNYGEVRNAEDLMNKIPKFYSLRENIENAKSDLTEYEKDLKEKEETLEELNKELLSLEKNEFFKQLDEKKDELFKLRIRINDQLGFKKALKKLKFGLEKESIHIANIDLYYLRTFLKNPIKALIKESPDLTKFRAILVHLRHALEENKLNLKTETKEKTIEQINAIFDEEAFQKNLEKMMQLRADIKNIKKQIEEKGLSEQLEEIKNQISINSVKLEHIQADLERRNRDYLRNLSSLKQERDNFQNLIEKVLEEPLKLNISFEF